MPTIQQTSQGTQTNTAVTTQSRSFALFGELPPELKAKILNIAAREVPRLIEVTPQGYQGHTPALLGVSRMAREEALRVYNTLRPGCPQPIYFNPDNDTIILNVETRVLGGSMALIFSLTPVALPPNAVDRSSRVRITDPSSVPEVKEMMTSLGIKSLVVQFRR
ncbi:hypothetical protein EAE96_009359 [Botrytis aclada]|nr:hypothetical protein EAE96_009359 [Botrytis aclada]